MADTDKETRQWALWLHLSLLAGLVVPFAGLVAPIIIWQVKKEELPGIDAHGKAAVNWIISSLIYFCVSFLLVFVVVGIFLLVVLSVVAVVFPIVAGVKAKDGVLWRYPLSINFLK